MAKKIFVDEDKLTGSIATHNLSDISHQDIRDKINVLSSGKLDNMIEKMSQSLNQKLDVGQYHFQKATDGFPDGYTLDNDFVLNVYPSSKGNIDWNRMILLDIRSDRIFTQRRTGGTLKGWKELATTTKTDILCTARTGYTILEQNSYQINNVVYIDVKVKRTDDAVIPQTQQELILLPIGKFNTSRELISYLGYSKNQGSMVGSGGNAVVWNGGLVYANVDNPNIYVLELKTSYVLR